MSEIKVNSIKGVGASAAAITVNNTDGTCTANITNNLSNKNLIINGACLISQRGTSVTSSATSGQYIVDRFFTFADATDQASFTHAQVSDAPTGFSKSFKLSVGTAETTLDANEALQFLQRIEAQDLQQLDNGLSTAKSVTLSFYVKSYQTGTFNVNLYKSDNTVRHISATYTVNQSATWEKKTITFAGDTSGGGIDDDNGNGLSVYWHLAAGSNFTSADSTSWGNYSAAGFAYGQAVNLMSSTDNYWQITGVQLEVGSVATDFEHRSFGQELALCKRYYNRFTAGGTYARFADGQVQSTDQAEFTFQHPVTMRAAPTFGYGGSVAGWTENSLKSISSIAIPDSNENMCTLTATTSGCTRGYAIDLIANGDATAYIELISEL